MLGRITRIIALLAALLMLSALMSGCVAAAIKEDSVKEDLPRIDPEAGISKDIEVELYYGLTNEAYLVEVGATVSVQANELPETAIVRALLAGTPPLSNNVAALFGENTGIVDVAMDGGIFYVTLSSAFLDTSLVTKAWNEGSSLREKGLISDAEYQARIDGAVAQMYLQRKLALYSMVNSITSYNDAIRVQVLVDVNDAGVGSRLERSEFGMEENALANSDLIEPLGFDGSLIATPMSVVECAFSRIQANEVEFAYPLFAEMESGGLQKPAYASFESEVRSLGDLTSFELNSYQMGNDVNYAYVEANMKWTTAAGEERSLDRVTILLKREGTLYKIGYASFMRLMEG